MDLVVVKKYQSEVEADIDATFLRANGVECVVNNAFSASVMPYLPTMITLSVMEDMEVKAIEMLEDPSKYE